MKKHASGAPSGGVKGDASESETGEELEGGGEGRLARKRKGATLSGESERQVKQSRFQQPTPSL